MNRTDRLLALLLELQGRDRVTAEELAATFEVTKRTIYRDIQALGESGVPVVSAPGQGYWLMEGYFLPPVAFSPDEAIMLLLGSEQMLNNFDAQYKQAALSASRKIEAVLTKEVQQEVSYLKDNIRFVSIDSGIAEVLETLQQLRRAIIEVRPVELSYVKRGAKDDPETSQRKVDPHGLVHFNGTWMLYAYCHLRTEMRMFRLDRITTFKVLDESFKRKQNASIRQYREPNRRKLKIELLFPKRLERWVKERPLFYPTTYEALPTGLKMTLYTFNEEEILGWLLGWGATVTVLSPESLKTRLEQELLNMLIQLKASKKPLP